MYIRLSLEEKINVYPKNIDLGNNFRKFLMRKKVINFFDSFFIFSFGMISNILK